jgi:hypothetical protein
MFHVRWSSKSRSWDQYANDCFVGNFTELLGWSLLELTLGVAAASLPVLGALLTIFPRPTGTGTARSDQRHSGLSGRPSARPKTSTWTSTRQMWREFSVRKQPRVQEIKLQDRTSCPNCGHSRNSDYDASLYWVTNGNSQGCIGFYRHFCSSTTETAISEWVYSH